MDASPGHGTPAVAVRKEVGYETATAATARPSDDERPFPEVGADANKVRIDCPDGWLRVMYVAKFVEATLA